MQPATILRTEDNEADIEVFRFALDRQGEEYELEILSDGEAALQFVSEHRGGLREPTPCAILLDLYLPRYDGLAVLRAIREAQALEHIHVVVLTGMASTAQVLENAAMGALHRTKYS